MDTIQQGFPIDYRAYYAEMIPWLDKSVGRGKADSNGWIENIKCPFHDEQNGSFGINILTGQYKCFGCEAKGDIFKFHMSRFSSSFSEAKNFIFTNYSLNQSFQQEKKHQESKKIHNKLGEPIKEYTYQDEAGKILYYVCRFANKEFRPCDANGVWKVKGLRAIPYNLPAFKTAQKIFICEGEKDAEAINNLGLVGTCKANWTGGWSHAFAKEFFNEKTVYIFQDNDEAGKEKAEDALNTLKQVETIGIKLIPPLGEKRGYDISDFIRDTGIDKDGLLAMVEDLPFQKETLQKIPNNNGMTFIIDIFHNNPQPCPLVEDFLEKEDSMIIHAAGGVGKSMFALFFALQVASKITNTNSMFLGRFKILRTLTTMFVQSENSAVNINKRIRKMVHGYNADEINFALNNICFAHAPDRRDIRTTGQIFENKEFRQKCRDDIKRFEDIKQKTLDLLIVDPLISFHSGDENDAGKMRSALDCVTEVVMDTNTTPIVLHHDNKNDDYRGSSAIQGWVRNMIGLKKKKDQESAEKELIINKPTFHSEAIVLEMIHEKANNMPEFGKILIEMDTNLRFRHIETYIAPALKVKCDDVKTALIKMGGYSGTNKELALFLSEMTGRSLRTCKDDISKAIGLGYIRAQKKESTNSMEYFVVSH